MGRITVYLGADPGSDPALKAAVRELGHWIGECGHALDYGGSKSGLMGELAQSVLRSGGEVTGVEPRFFVDAGFAYDAITQLIVTEDMAQRKTKMIELGDAFIAFPGGTGTLEEIAEVMSKVSLGHLDAPCILYNLNGYYDGLKTQLAYMIRMGLSSQEKQAGMREKYVDKEVSVASLLDAVEVDFNRSIDEKDQLWKKEYLSKSVMEESVEALNQWKRETAVLPKYLSADTMERYLALLQEVDTALTEKELAYIELLFNELNEEEKEQCRLRLRI